MIVRRFLLTAGVVLAAGLALAPPAAAASPEGAWTDPEPSASVEGVPLATLDAAGRLAGVADFDGGIQSVAFRLTQDADDPSRCSAIDDTPPQVKTYDSTHVRFAFNASFPCNTRYQVAVTVTPTQRALRQDTPTELPLWIDVALPPPATSGLNASTIASRRAVALRWDDAEHAPDFLGFDVRRSVDGAKFESIGSADASATSFVDEELPAGGTTVTYRVVGERSGPRPGSSVSGPNGDDASVVLDGAPSGGSGEGSTSGTGSSGSVGGSTGRTDVPKGGVRGASRSFQAPGPTTPTTADTGFAERLPFQRRTEVPTGGNSAVARLPEDDEGTTRQTALLVAGGGVAFSWAMALRFLSRRLAI